MTTNFNINGTDVDQIYLTKSYLISRYPDIFNTFKASGLYLWGYNGEGILGNNSTTNRSSPVQTIASGANWRQVSFGSSINSSCGAIKTDGTLWMWGPNNFGQLGNLAGTTSRSSPVTTSTGGTNWRQLSTNENTTAAVKTDGTLWTWGRNNYGQLGINSTVASRSSPSQTISGGSLWKQVSSGGSFVGAIKTDGTLWTWGFNNSGQLGHNNTTNRSSPVALTGSGSSTWRQVASGVGINSFGLYGFMAAIKTDGTLWTWGSNSRGQIGDNSTVFSRSSPVQTVAGGTNWISVAATASIGAGIKNDGSLWLWGKNSQGNLADNTSVARSSPIQTVSGGTNWKQVALGDNITGAIKTDGSLWLWGDNQVGGLGIGSITAAVSSPIQTIASGYNWTQCSFSSQSGSAIRNFDDY